MNQNVKIILISAVVGALAGGGAFFAMQKSYKPSTNELIKEFYEVENAAHVSPHGLRGKLDKGGAGIVIVDLRSPQEYEREHIISAVNIPAYTDPNTPAYEEVDRIVGQFRELIAANPGKEIVTYCYSIPCMTGRKIGKMLVENDIYVKTLGIGWNEWRYFWTLWNHEHEWKTTKPEDYIWKGKEPGIPVLRELPSACGEGEFSC
ncbi:MAG: rhodanese-like domain-containing protein [Patescibacteria group bacterium]